jgi:Transposase DDE domain
VAPARQYARLLKRGLVLMTKVRKHMKVLPLALTDKLRLNARNMARTIIGHIKAFSSLNFPRHRAPINAFLHLLAALTAYQFNPIKPDVSFLPLFSLPA